MDDSRNSVRYSAFSFRDFQKYEHVFGLLLEIRGETVLELRVRTDPGEFREGGPPPAMMKFTYELKGHEFTFGIRDFLGAPDAQPVDDEASALGLIPEPDVLEALARVSSFLHAKTNPPLRPESEFAQGDVTCLDFMPRFVREQCRGEYDGDESSWEQLENDCDFDASFGVPCDPTMVDVGNEWRDMESNYNSDAE